MFSLLDLDCKIRPNFSFYTHSTNLYYIFDATLMGAIAEKLA